MSYVYITEENARIQKKNGRFLVGRNLEILFVGSIQVSSQAMISLAYSYCTKQRRTNGVRRPY